jgi:hypothetical protein
VDTTRFFSGYPPREVFRRNVAQIPREEDTLLASFKLHCDRVFLGEAPRKVRVTFPGQVTRQKGKREALSEDHGRVLRTTLNASAAP